MLPVLAKARIGVTEKKIIKNLYYCPFAFEGKQSITMVSIINATTFKVPIPNLVGIFQKFTGIFRIRCTGRFASFATF